MPQLKRCTFDPKTRVVSITSNRIFVTRLDDARIGNDAGIFCARPRRKAGLFPGDNVEYYMPLLGERVAGVPGVESVTKQFLYQVAYRDFVLAHGFSRVVNALLVPSCGDAVEHLGRVRFPGVIAAEEPPFSNEAELYALPTGRCSTPMWEGGSWMPRTLPR